MLWNLLIMEGHKNINTYLHDAYMPLSQLDRQNKASVCRKAQMCKHIHTNAHGNSSKQ